MSKVMYIYKLGTQHQALSLAFYPFYLFLHTSSHRYLAGAIPPTTPLEPQVPSNLGPYYG